MWKLIEKIIASTLILIVFFTIPGLFPALEVFSFAPQIAQAAFNKQINYQGKLTTPLNVAAADGVYHMRFALYTSATGGAPVWQEDRSTAAGDRVTLSNGLFSVMLGSSTPLSSVNFDQTLYLGVEVGGSAGSPTWDGEMTPRKVLGAVPAAFVSDTLDNLDSTQFVRTDTTSTIATSSVGTALTINQSGAGDIFTLQSGGNPVFTVQSTTGNVGIGTTTPYQRLSVVGNILAEGLIRASSFVGTSTATSTLGGGLDISSGCFAQNGTCLTQGLTSAITAIGPAGQTQTGGVQTLATSTAGTDFTITALANTQTFNFPFASASANGKLSSFDWTVFNNKISSSSLSGASVISYNAGTGVITTLGGTFGAGNYVFPNDVTITGNSTTTNATSTNIFTTNLSASNFRLSGVGANMSVATDGSGNLVSTSTPQFASLNATSSTATSTFAGGLTVGTSNFVVDRNSGNVGIGSTTPSTKLSVTGNGYFTGGLGVGVVNTNAGTLRTSGAATIGGNLALSSLLNCNSSSQAIQSDGSGILSCGTITGGGASVGGGWASLAPNIVRLATTTDLVGVGTTSPYAKFSVSSGSTSTTTLAVAAVNGQTANVIDIYNNLGVVADVFTSQGDLGLGSTTPSEKLAVNGNVAVDGFVRASTFTATSTTANSVFPRLSFTSATGTSATTTNFAISGIASSLLKTNANGSILAAIAGTDFENALTFGTGLSRTVNAVSCNTASGTTFGCLGTADWSIFNNKISSSSLDTSVKLASLITDETGTGSLVFGTLPTLQGFLSTASSTLQNFTAVNSTSTSATTTNFFTTNFVTNNFRLGGVGTTMLLGTDASGNIVSTSTPQVASINATSTTATSTFAGGLVVTGGGGGLNFAVDRNTGNVGVATATPSTNFSVLGNGYFTGGLGVGAVNTTPGSIVTTGAVTINGILTASTANTHQIGQVTFGNASRIRVVTNTGEFSVNNSGEAFLMGGNMGIGTTSPYARLSVVGQVVGANFTATTSALNTFPQLSFTSATGTSATTTNFFATNLAFTTITGGNLTSTGLVTANNFLANASSTFQNFTGINSTTTSATSTNLYSANANLGNLSVGNSTTTNATTTTFAVTGSATSTFANGIALSGGCFLMNGSCLGQQTSWSALADPLGSLSLNMGTNSTNFNWSTGTGASDLFALTTNNNANGVGNLLLLQTGVGSTVKPLRVLAGNTDALMVDASGNVGVGTTSPYTKLGVAGDIAADGFVRASTFTATSTTADSVFPRLSFTSATGTSATTTNFFSTNFATNNLRLSGVGTTMLLSTDGSGNIVSSSTPQVASLNATSTTATSTFSGGLSVIKGTNPSFSVDRSTGFVGVGTGSSTSAFTAIDTSASTGRAGSLFEVRNAISGANYVVARFSAAGSGSQSPGIALASNGSDIFNITNNVSGTGVTRFDALAGSMSFAFNSVEAIRFNSNGNVGIGTSSPYAKLSIAGEVVGANFTATSTTATSTFAGGFTAGTSGLTVLQNGAVGIGTTSPTKRFSVNVDTYVTGTFGVGAPNNGANGTILATGNITAGGNLISNTLQSAAAISMVDGSSGTLGLGSSIAGSWAGGIGFNPGSATKMTLLTAGYLGLGTTTPSGALMNIATSTAPQLALSDGTATSNAWAFRNTGGTLYIATSSPSTFATSTVSAFSINNNGIPTFPSLGGGALPGCVQVLTSGALSNTGASCVTSAITAIGPAGQTQTGATQTLATSTTGTDFTITAGANTQTFNLPFASLTSNGKLSSADWSIFNNKISSTSLDTSAKLASLITDETGTGSLVFGTLPTLQGFISNASSTIYALTATTATTTNATSTNLFATNFVATNATTTTFAVTGSATSTFANGIALSGGCFLMNGSCLGQQTSWSALADPLGSLSLNMGTNSTNFNWSTGTGASDLFALTTNNNANGVGNLLLLQTGVGSTVKPLRVLAGNTDALMVDASGNVGVGTTSPYTKLGVAGDIAADGFVRASTFTATSTTADSVFPRLSFTSATGTSATTTNFFSTNFATNNLRLSGVGTTMLLSTDGSGNIVSSSTPQVASLNATSTTATSTFAGGMTVGAANLVVDRSTGNVGIGLASPSAKLFVATGVNGVSPVATFQNTPTGASIGTPLVQLVGGNSSTYIGGIKLDGSTGALSLQTGSTAVNTQGTDNFTLLANGNVGIGTTSPYAKLSVAGEVVGSYFTGTSTATSSFYNLTTTGTATSTFNRGINLNGGCFAIAGTCLTQGLTSAITAIGPAGQTQTGATQTLATSTTGTDFTITASGNTQTFNLPFASLTANGKLSSTDWSMFNNKISSSSLSGASVISYNSSTGVITTAPGTFGGSGAYSFGLNSVTAGTGTNSAVSYGLTNQPATGMNFPSPGNISFVSVGTEYARLASSGNFGIGTTSPLAKLDVAGLNNATTPLLQLSSVASFATTTRFSVSNSGDMFVSGSTTLQNFTAVNATTTQATTTSLAISSIASSLLKTNANGSVLAAVAGTDFENALTFNTAQGLTRTGNSVACNTASVTTFGCLTSTDWSIFNNKISSTSLDTSAKLASLITDETGSGLLVFGTLPTLQGFISNASSTIYALTATAATTTSATSTNLFATNFTATNFSLSGVGTTMLLGNDASGNIVSTSTPVVAAINATSTTATSTFAGILSVGSSTPYLNPLFLVATSTNSLFAVNKNSGNVGIGSTSPMSLFTVAGGAQDTAVVRISDATSPTLILEDRSDAGGLGTINFMGNGTTRATIFGRNDTATGNSLIFGTTAEAMRIIGAGRIGMGTTTPNGGFLNIATSSIPQLALSDASLTSDQWTFRNAGGFLYVATSSPSTFATSTASAFSINSNGIPTFASLGGTTGCAQFSSTGALSNTGTACGSSGSAYPFALTGNATSTLTQFNGGLTAYASSTITALTVTTGTTTSATSTNLFATNLTFTTATGGNITSTGLVSAANILATGSTTLQNFTGLNSTTTNATTTNLNIGEKLKDLDNLLNIVASTANDGVMNVAGTGGLSKFFQINSPAGGTLQFAGSSLKFYPAAVSRGTSITTTGNQNGAWDSTTGNIYTTGSIGIGTTSPLAKLDVAGANNATTPLFQLSSVASFATTTRFSISNSGDMFVSGSTTLQNFTASNSTTTSATSTNLFATSLSATNFRLSGTGTTMLLGTDASGNIVSTSTPVVASINATSTTATSTFAGGLSVAGSAGLTVLQNGNVGVGSSSPGSKLAIDIAQVGTLNPFSIGGINLNAQRDIAMVDLYATYEFGGSSNNLYGVRSIPKSSSNSGNVALNNYAFYGAPSGATNNWGIFLTGEDKNYFSGNVGIGTTSPYAKLSVAGEVVGVNFTATSTTATSTFAGGLSVAGTNGLTVLQNGNVGLASSSPSSRLSVVGSGYFSGSVAVGSTVTFGNTATNISGDSNNFIVKTANTSNAHIKFFVNAGNNQIVDFSSDTTFPTLDVTPISASQSTLFRLNGAGTVVFKNGGYFGVGTTTPNYLMNLASSTAPQLALSDGTATSNAWTFRNTGGTFYLATSSPSTFATSTASAFSISSNGIPTFASLGGTTGCAQFSSTGALSNTGTACGSGSGSAYPFALTGNATSTLTQFNGGLTAYASSTITALTVTTGTTTSATSTNLFATNLSATSFSLTGAGTSMLLGTDASGNVVSTSTPQVASINATSTTATSTFANTVSIGSTTPSGSALFSVGTSSPLFTIDRNNGSVMIGNGTLLPGSPLSVHGNTNSYLQANIQNASAGSSASSDWVATNDIGNNSSYYIDFGINSSTYNDGAYSIGDANDAYLYAQSEALSIGTATSSALGVIKFHTGGTLASNERMRIDVAGNVGIGTTTPSFLLNLATSTAPQLALSDGTATSNAWTFRNTGGTFYLATSSPSTFATSTASAFSINSNGIPTFASLGGTTGCAQFSSTGALSNTGTACGSGSGSAYPFALTGNATSTLTQFNGGLTAYASSTITALTVTTGTTTSATSTNLFATNLSATNFRLSGVGASMLLGTDASGNVVSTSTPVVAAINATSTTATSTFAGGMSIAGSSGLTVVQGGGQILIGAGTPPVNAKLQISSTGATGDLGLIINATGGTGEAGFIYSRSGTFLGEMGFAGTAGQVLTTSATNDLAIKSRSGDILFGGTVSDTERMRITNSGNVGIGTTTPRYLFNLATSTAPQLALSDGTATSNAWTMRSIGNFLYFATSSPSTFATSTNPALTITNNGNFGIASSTPAAKFSVTGDGYFTGGLGVGAVNTTAGTIRSTGNITAGGSLLSNTLQSGGAISMIDGSGGTLIVGNTTGWTSMAFNPGSATKMTLLPGGYLGLGTTTPSGSLMNIATSTAPQLSLSDASLTSNQWAMRTISSFFYLATSSPATFATSTTAALTIDRNGNFGIASSTPAAKFSVTGDGYFTGGLGVGAVNTTPGSITVTGAITGGSNSSLSFANVNTSQIGQAVFGNATRFQVNDTSGLSPIYYDSAGRFAVGTTTPQWALQVASTTRPQLTLSDSGSSAFNHWSFRNSGGTFYLATSSPSTFATSTNSALTIDLNGNFGIASTTPATNLSVAGNGYFTGGLGLGVLNTTAGSIQATGNIRTAAQVQADTITGTGGAVMLNNNGASTVLGGSTSWTSVLFSPGNVERARITSGGYMGIGTTTPQFLLSLATSTAPQLSLSDGTLTSNQWTMRSIGGNLYFATSSPSTFATSTVSALTILNGSGNVGVGTSTPYTRFAVQGEAAAAYFTSYSTATSTFNGPILVSTIATNNSGTAGLIIGSTSTPQILGFDTINNRTQVGLGTGTAAPVLFVLDTKNTSGDPTGTNGAMYYNSNSGQFRCFENSAWTRCITSLTGATGTPVAILNAFATPDTGGNSWFQPNIIENSSSIFGNMVAVASSTTAKTGFYGTFQVPEDFSSNSIACVVWSTGLTTGNVVWNFSYRSVGGDNTTSLNQGTFVETASTTAAAPGTANFRKKSCMTLTAGNFTKGDTVEFYLNRDGSDTNDTLGNGAQIYQTFFEYLK